MSKCTFEFSLTKSANIEDWMKYVESNKWLIVVFSFSWRRRRMLYNCLDLRKRSHNFFIWSQLVHWSVFVLWYHYSFSSLFHLSPNCSRFYSPPHCVFTVLLYNNNISVVKKILVAFSFFYKRCKSNRLYMYTPFCISNQITI